MSALPQGWLSARDRPETSGDLPYRSGARSQAYGMPPLRLRATPHPRGWIGQEDAGFPRLASRLGAAAKIERRGRETYRRPADAKWVRNRPGHRS